MPDGAIARLGRGPVSDSDRSLAFSPNGRYFALVGNIGVWLYEVEPSRLIALLPTEDKAHSVAFSPDGTTLASGLANGLIEIWEVKTGTRIATLQGPNWIRVNSLAFSPDGSNWIAPISNICA